jgi:hypothetical protein
MSEKRELAQVAETLGLWRAAGKAVLAIHDLMSRQRELTEDEREHFELLVTLFDYASKGAQNVEARRLLLSSDSAREYSAFLDVVNAFASTEAQSSPDAQRFSALLDRLKSATVKFFQGERPQVDDALFLARVLRAIAAFNSLQASEAFYSPVYSFSPRLP